MKTFLVVFTTISSISVALMHHLDMADLMKWRIMCADWWYIIMDSRIFSSFLFIIVISSPYFRINGLIGENIAFSEALF